MSRVNTKSNEPDEAGSDLHRSLIWKFSLFPILAYDHGNMPNVLGKVANCFDKPAKEFQEHFMQHCANAASMKSMAIASLRADSGQKNERKGRSLHAG